MVKNKKGKRGGKDDDLDDDVDSNADAREITSNTKGLKDTSDNEDDSIGKKSGKGKKGDAGDDVKVSKKKTKKGKTFYDSDEESVEKVKKKTKKKGDVSDDDIDNDNKESVEKVKKKNKKKGDVSDDEFDNDNKESVDKVKKKNKKKNDVSDDEFDNENRESVDKVKKKNKKKGDVSDDEFDNDNKDDKSIKKKGKKGKKKDEDDDNDIESDEEGAKMVKSKKAQKPRGGFALLQMDDDDSNDGDEPPDRPDSPEEVIQKSKPVGQDKNQKKGKKSKKKKEDDDDDLEKVLAELEMEYSGVKPKEEVKAEEPAAVKEKAAKKAKNKKKDEKDEQDDENKGEEGVSTVKSAAQKKKEKKERQKLERREEARAEKEAAKAEPEKVKPEKPEPEKVEPEKVEPKPVVTEEVADKDEGDQDKDAKKDKKKKGKGKEEKKDEKADKKKGPGSKTIAAMQEALKKIKEEEERLKREEEERIKREEEAERIRQEILRIEKEKKELKKKKEKERKERLKAEGKFLTAKQKADKARAQEMINALRAQGVDLPDPGEKKPRPGTRVRPNKSKTLVSQDSSDASEPKPAETSPGPEQVQVEIVDTKQETGKEEVETEVKDTWDAESSDEEDASEKEKAKTKEAQEEVDTKEASEEESESEEEDDEDEDEDEEEEESSEEESESEDEHKTDAEKKREKAFARIQKRKEDAEKHRSVENLRAAVVCVLGHVDTGKTKILDKLRRTNVQDGEAGGITQQIGATNVPIDNIKETCKLVKGFTEMKLKIPGLLIIDTPGHESFSNLRSRGSSLCDIAILVVDIMHGLEPQTIESINLLKTRKTPFLVALNKIDRLYNWQTGGRKDIRDILKSQAENTQLEFKQRTNEVTVQFAEQGLNAALFFDNPDIRSYVSLIPTSAITGEGMGNLLALIVEFSQNMLARRLMYSELLLATVLEVKAIPGLGTTIDCILINGKLAEGDTIILAGTDGPIVTQIRSLLMPQPMKELRVKNAYIEYKEIKAAQGVKIAAKDLEKAIAGLNLQVAQKPDEIPIYSDEVAKELKSALSSIKLKERGVYVQASTLGSLEALLEFLRTSKIPYSGIRIGPVVKKDVMKASIMLEHESQYATILAFDVKIERDAQELADSLGVKIFQADIIYHLFDKFMAYREELKQKKRDEFKHIAVFPCKLRILPQFVFNTRDPIVVGVMVEAGVVREGTPLCVPSKEFVNLGIVTSVEVNHKPMESARKGQEVCIKIENPSGETPKLYGRHFDHTDLLMSRISRQSIDACKDYFRDDLTKQDWQLMVELKKLFQIL